MIRTALEFVGRELESYIVLREQDPNYTIGNVVDIKSIALPTGEINITNTSHITVTLVGVDEERREGKRPYYAASEDKNFYKLNPPIELDLFVLFVANNQDHKTALRDLSDVIGFFQANPIFDAEKFPNLNTSVIDPSSKPWQLIERLVFSLHSLSFEQQNNLWSMLGAKYIPSVVFKMKMLTFFENKSQQKLAAIHELNFAGSSES